MLKKYYFLFVCLYFSNNLLARDFKALYYKSLGPTFEKKNPPSTVNSEMIFNRDLNKKVYSGSIKIGNQFIEDIPVRIYYKGDIIPCQYGIYHFFSEKNLKDFHLLIALIESPKNSTIKSLMVPKKTNYILYSLTQEVKHDKCLWVINEKRGNNGLNIPNNALIIQIEAQFIEGLATREWKYNTFPIPFPSLILKKSITNSQETTDKAILESLNIDIFHKKLSTSTKIQGQKSSIALAQEINL